MTVIETDGVSKRYGGVTAVRDLDLTVESGEVFGFLGPNGAGKSTTIDLLLNYRRPSSGSITVLGRDVTSDAPAVRKRVGILPEGFEPFETMTGRAHVAYAVAARRADDDPGALLDRVGLATAGDRPAREYSKGMKQRLALAMALAGDPDLLVLDEPSTGLDPHGVKRMREIVRTENDRGATVFFSSHVLGQVEAVCDRVGILRSGELVTVDTIDGLRRTVGAVDELAIDIAGDPADYLDAVGAIDGVDEGRIEEERLVVACESGAKLAVLDELRTAGATVRDFSTAEATLEDLYLAHTGGVA